MVMGFILFSILLTSNTIKLLFAPFDTNAK